MLVAIEIVSLIGLVLRLQASTNFGWIKLSVLPESTNAIAFFLLIDKVMLDFFKPAGTPSKEAITHIGEYIAAVVSS